MRLTLFASTITLATTAFAQNTAVAPIDNTATSGPMTHIEGDISTTRYPFSNGVSRLMYLYETSDAGRTLLDIPNGRTITSIAYPRDANTISFGESLLLEVWMASTMRTTETATRTYADNYTSPPTLVRNRAIFQMPNLGDVTSPPVLTEIEVPLDTPFTFDASQNLIVEFRVFANSNGNQLFTYRLDATTDVSPVTSYGLACMTSSGRQSDLRSGNTAIGDRWWLWLNSAPASSAATLLIGAQGLTPGILIPGAGTCTLDVSPFVSIPGSTNTAGSGSWNFPIPNDVQFWHLSLFTQVSCTDFFANALGVVTSNGEETEFGINPRIALIHSAGDANAASGSLLRSFGQITYFNHN